MELVKLEVKLELVFNNMKITKLQVHFELATDLIAVNGYLGPTWANKVFWDGIYGSQIIPKLQVHFQSAPEII